MDTVHDLHDGIRFLVGIIKRSRGDSFQSKFCVGNIKTERHFCQIVLTNLLDMSTNKKNLECVFSPTRWIGVLGMPVIKWSCDKQKHAKFMPCSRLPKWTELICVHYCDTVDWKLCRKDSFFRFEAKTKKVNVKNGNLCRHGSITANGDVLLQHINK